MDIMETRHTAVEFLSGTLSGKMFKQNKLTRSVLIALSAGTPSVNIGFPAVGPVMKTFDSVFLLVNSVI